MPSNTNVFQFPTRAGVTPRSEPASPPVRAATPLTPQAVRRPGMKPLGTSLAQTLRDYCGPDQRVIWRGEQHWATHDGTWAARFDECTIEELAYAFNYLIVVNCQHAAIVTLNHP